MQSEGPVSTTLGLLFMSARSYAMILFATSRFVCTYLLKYIEPGSLLMYLSIGAILLLFPVIFISYVMPIICFVVIAIFGYRTFKIHNA